MKAEWELEFQAGHVRKNSGRPFGIALFPISGYIGLGQWRRLISMIICMIAWYLPAPLLSLPLYHTLQIAAEKPGGV
jgi:hypothetical protein